MASQLNLFELVAMATEPLDIKNTFEVPAPIQAESVVEPQIIEEPVVTYELQPIQEVPVPTVQGVRVFKKGKYLGLKALDARSSIILSEFINRMNCERNCDAKVFNIPGGSWSVGLVNLRDIIEHTIEASTQVLALKSMQVELIVDQQLLNYLNKERRRWEIERTPYIRDEQTLTSSLFERCVTGMVLNCTKDFSSSKKKLFSKGQNYLVVDISEDGESSVCIGTVPIVGDSYHGLDKNLIYNWSQFDVPMEEHFEEQDLKEHLPDMSVRFPELLKKATLEIEKKNFPLFKHVAVDAAQAKNRRRVFNSYLMRMAKAQPLDAIIMTPNGPKTMGDMQAGTDIFGRDGKAHKVSGVYPQGLKPVYKVIFRDGSSTECCGEHLWDVQTPTMSNLGYKSKVRSLDEMLSKGLTHANGNAKYFIPLVKPLEFETKNLTIDPYLLGSLIGDGCLQKKSSPKFSTADLETISEFKFIPFDYKYASIDQRKALLSGLLDTNGCIWLNNKETKSSIIEYTSSSFQLAKDVQFLVQSLGGTAKLSTREPSFKYKGFEKKGLDSYKLRIVLDGSWNPFRLTRKAEKFVPREKYGVSRAIVSAELVGTKECQCIMVDTPDHSYVTDECIVTHNTSFAIAVNELWDSKSIAIVSPTIARHFWVLEFNRMGFKEGEDFVQIKSFADTKHPAKYHLYTLPWLRRVVDSNEKARYKGRTILGMAEHKNEKGVVEWTNTTPCPHCNELLQRREKIVDHVKQLSEDGSQLSTREIVRYIWTTYRGYRCRNKLCTWSEKAKEVKKNSIHATPWSSTKARKGKGGYINWELIDHAHCAGNGTEIKGRMCLKCKTADGEWTPGRYKRVKKLYTCLDVDEAHEITNKSSRAYQAISAMKAKRKVDLTGTPMGKSPLDIYWPFHQTFGGGSMIFPYSQSKGRTEFADKFCNQITLEKDAGSITDSDGKVTTVKKLVKKIIPFVKNPPEFWKFTSNLMIRRTYTDKLYLESLKEAGMFMPKSDPQLFPVSLNPEQAKLMLKSIEDFKNAFSALEKEAKAQDTEVNMARVQNMPQMITLRILATCPEYLNQKLGKEVYKGKPGGAKMTVIRQIVEDRLKQGKKIVILSDFKAMQKAVADEFSHNGLLRFMPDWDESERSEAFDMFKSDPKIKIAVAGTQAVRQSADLSAADVFICTDLLWSPVRQTQAWSRGLAPTKRERTCEILLLCATGTIDMQIFEALYQALAGSQQALDRTSTDKRVRKVDAYWFRDRILETEKYLREFLSEEAHVKAPAMPKANFMEMLND